MNTFLTETSITIAYCDFKVVSQAMVICDAFGRRSIDLEIVENMEMKLNLAFNFLTIFFDSVASSGNSVHRKLATVDATEFCN